MCGSWYSDFPGKFPHGLICIFSQLPSQKWVANIYLLVGPSGVSLLTKRLRECAGHFSYLFTSVLPELCVVKLGCLRSEEVILRRVSN